MKHILFLLSLISFAVLAEEEKLETIQIEAKAEAASWKEQDKTKILSGKKNRTSKINYLPPIQTDNSSQVFSQQPSIYTAALPNEPWASLNFRGIGDPHEGGSVFILQDGLPTNIDPYGSPNNYYLPPAPLMDGVQVIAGGGALLYGPSATGTINYLSPRLEKGMATRGRLNVAGGSYNLISTVNSLTGSKGNTSYYAGYYRKQGEGYQRDNADFAADYVQLKTATYLENNSILKLGLQGYDSDFGMAGGMAKAEGPGLNTWSESGNNRKATRQHDRLKISRAQFNVGVEKKLSSQTQLDATLWTVAYRRDGKTQTANASPFGSFPTANTNIIRKEPAYSLNGEVRLGHEWEKADNKHQLQVGYTTYNTNSPTVQEAGSMASNGGTVTQRAVRTSRVQAVFAENRFNIGRFSLVPGVRYENITLTSERLTKSNNQTVKGADTYNVFLGGLGASTFLTETTQAFVNASQGFRPATFGDVLSAATPNSVVKGDIEPSYTYTYEAGLRGETEKINWDTSLYLIHRQNIIASSSSGGVTTITNGRSAQYRGVEAALTLKDAFNRKSVHEYDLYLNGNYVNAQYNGGTFKGKTPAYAPSLFLKYGVIYRYQDKLKTSLLGTFVNEHYANDNHASNFKIPSYMVYDLLAEYALSPHWSVNGALNNILDEAYYARVQDAGIQPTMGRNVYAGATYRF